SIREIQRLRRAVRVWGAVARRSRVNDAPAMGPEFACVHAGGTWSCGLAKTRFRAAPGRSANTVTIPRPVFDLRRPALDHARTGAAHQGETPPAASAQTLSRGPPRSRWDAPSKFRFAGDS